MFTSRVVLGFGEQCCPTFAIPLVLVDESPGNAALLRQFRVFIVVVGQICLIYTP